MRRQSFQIAVICPPGHPNLRPYFELAETLVLGFQALGVQASAALNNLNANAANLLLGFGFLNDEQFRTLPPQTILYNLEPIRPQAASLPRLLSLFRGFETWDYSRRNLALLTGLGASGRLRHAPLGYRPEMSRVPTGSAEDIDVLIYGPITDRRRPIYQALEAHGVRVQAVSGVSGAAWDAYVARSRLVLDLRPDDGGFDLVQAAYLLANRKAVVAECPDLADVDPDYRDALRLVAAEQVVPTCLALLADAAGRQALAERGRQIYSRCDERSVLAPLLEAPATSQPLAIRDAPPNRGDQLTAQLQQLVRSGKAEEALVGAARIVMQAFSREDLAGRLVFSAELDGLVRQVGDQLIREHFPDVRLAFQRCSPVQVFLATEVYAWGGHTRVLETILENTAGVRSVLLLTDLFDHYRSSPAFRNEAVELFRRRGVEVYILESSGVLNRIRELVKLLCLLAPVRVFLFAHHQDVIAYAAASPLLDTRFLYIHHADHNLTLGATFTHVAHVDLHAFGYRSCARALGGGNFYLPFTISDRGVRRLVTKPRGTYNTATSGTWNKFNPNYEYAYVRMLPSILSAHAGQHVHIGPVPPSARELIAGRLREHGVDAERFRHVEHVPSLWQAMTDYDVDLYLGSFPVGGGRATIEVMGSGTPVVLHGNQQSGLLRGAGLSYPEAYLWRTPDDLLQILRNLRPEDILAQGALARAWYEKHYSLAHFRDCLTKLLAGDRSIVPQPLTEELPSILSFSSCTI